MQIPLIHSLNKLLLVAALAFAFAAPIQAQAQADEKRVALKSVESYLKKVMAANSANAPVPKPNVAELAGLTAFKAKITEDDAIGLDRIPAKPLREIKSVNDLNLLMRQLQNPGPYQKAAARDAREAERRVQISALKQSDAGPSSIMLSKSNRERMNNLGIILDANDQIVAGGKTFDPMNTEPSQLIEALGLPPPPNVTDKASVKAQEAMQRNVQAVLEEIREKLGAKQKTGASKAGKRP